jgi:hypothetical protein
MLNKYFHIFIDVKCQKMRKISASISNSVVIFFHFNISLLVMRIEFPQLNYTLHWTLKFAVHKKRRSLTCMKGKELNKKIHTIAVALNGRFETLNHMMLHKKTLRICHFFLLTIHCMHLMRQSVNFLANY